MRRPSRQGTLAVCLFNSNDAVDGHSLHRISFSTRYVCCLVFVLSPFISKAQDATSGKDDFFHAVQKGQSHSIEETRGKFPDSLARYVSDSGRAIASTACEVVARLCAGSADISMRRNGVDILLRGCRRPEPEVSGAALEHLTAFHRNDFTQSAADTLRKLFRSNPYHLAPLMKLIAFLDLKDLVPDIRPFTTAPRPTSVRWAAILSLSRMGEREATDELIRRVKKFPVRDDVVYTLFPDLAFTRQPEAVAYMIEALNSDARNCHSADAEREVAIPCGYRIMEQLAPVIEGFPLELEHNGDLRTDDYAEALETVRMWFRENNRYTIRKDKY